VSPALLQRQAALAAGALLATLGVLALGEGDEQPAPLQPPEVSIEWQRAVVGILPARADGRETACGTRLGAGTIGVAHPLLPCGADLVVEHQGTEVRAEVVDRAVTADGAEFLVTRALARELGLDGETPIRWRFPG
jgi:hypothetical protein